MKKAKLDRENRANPKVSPCFFILITETTTPARIIKIRPAKRLKDGEKRQLIHKELGSK